MCHVFLSKPHAHIRLQTLAMASFGLDGHKIEEEIRTREMKTTQTGLDITPGLKVSETKVAAAIEVFLRCIRSLFPPAGH